MSLAFSEWNMFIKSLTKGKRLLTISDIDFKNHSINVNHQLQKRATVGYYIEEPKTEPMIDGRTGLLYFDKDGSVVYSLHWEHYFKHIVQKYNKTYKVQIPKITPHVCRHTYCSNMAKSVMNPKTLKL